MADIFKQFRKGSGQAPQYGTLAPVPANKTGKYVQSFDERAIMQEQPPRTESGPRGNPKPDEWDGQQNGKPDSPTYPRRIRVYDELANVRADNQVLVRETPSSRKGEKNAWPSALRIQRDESSGEGA